MQQIAGRTRSIAWICMMPPANVNLGRRDDQLPPDADMQMILLMTTLVEDDKVNRRSICVLALVPHGEVTILTCIVSVSGLS